MAGKLKVHILIMAMALLIMPLSHRAKAETPILIASADTQYLIAGYDPSSLLASSNSSYLVAGSNSSSLLADSTQNPYAGYYAASPVITDPSAAGRYIVSAPQSRSNVPFLNNGIYQPIIPISRETEQTSWFSYGYMGNYQNSKHRSAIHMNPIQTEMGLGFEYWDEKRKYGDYESKQSGYKFFERISFSTNGWFYNRNLLKYSLFFSPEFSQYFEDNDENNQSENYFSPDFRLTLTAFDYKPAKLHFHAFHENNISWTPYSGPTEIITDSMGGDAEYDMRQIESLGRVYSNLSYNFIKTEDEQFYKSESETHSLNLTSSQKSTRSDGKLKVKYSDIDRTRTSSNISETRDQYQTLDTLLSHELYLSDQNRSNIGTLATYNIMDYQTNTYEYLSLGSSLNLYHSPTFKSSYKVGYARNQNENSDGADTYGGQASLAHWLYENLFTDAGILANYHDYGDSNNTDINPYLRFDYTRDIPWGNFSLLAGWDYKVILRDGLSNNSLFQNEQHTARYGVDITLAQESINVSTIVVSGTNPPEVFINEIDYEVEVIGSRTVLRILPLGAINDGQTISVQYNYANDSSYDSSFLRHHYGFKFHLFKQLEFNYNYSLATEDVLSGTVPVELTENSSHRAQVVYTYRWTRSEATYEIRDYQDDSIKSLYLNETLNIPLFSRGDLSLGATWGNTEYDSINGDVDYYGTSVNFHWNFAQWCKLSVTGHYQKTESQLSDVINSGIRTTLSFYYRIWQANLYWQYLNQEQVGSKSDVQRESNLIRFDIIRLRW